MSAARTRQEALEAAFSDALMAYYRRAGRSAAYALLSRLADAADDGADQRELADIAAQALAELPVLS